VHPTGVFGFLDTEKHKGLVDGRRERLGE